MFKFFKYNLATAYDLNNLNHFGVKSMTQVFKSF